MKTDFIIIGTGLAGLTSALTLSEFGEVLLVSKVGFLSGSSRLAQGGIAAAVGKDDSFKSHIDDTMEAGARYNDTDAVRFLIQHGPEAIKWLENQGIKFDREANNYSLGREAAHSTRRVLHITDFTGLAIVEQLIEKVRNNKRINCLENCFFLDLLTVGNKCYGARFLFKNQVFDCYSRGTVLASGGLGQVYLWTTNPPSATGDGIAAGFRAGTVIKDLEFIQFHPTALAHGKSPLFLLSEAIRGEGAILINDRGERFMEKYDSHLELAPRDIISRAIYREQQNSNKTYLDIRHKGKNFLQKRFPNIYTELEHLGFNMSIDLLPVTPAAHYSCGGIIIDSYGRTNITGLFAFGEVSCSGVHGANRLASNSLLEAVVFPKQLGKAVMDLPEKIKKIKFELPEYSPEIKFPHIKNKLQKLMWEKVGIIRSTKNLLNALDQISEWEKEFQNSTKVNTDFITLKNMLTASRLITQSASIRKESLGAHNVNN